MSDQVMHIPVDELMPDPSQPRKTFLEEELRRLATSIAARGVLAPLRVLRDDSRQCWRIVIGENRWRAGKMAGLATLPCLPIEGDPEEVDLISDQIIENHCRASLRPLELARAIAKLKALKRCSSQSLAAELGLSGSSISRAEALLTLPEAIQEQVDAGNIPESAAYELSRLPDEQSQFGLAQSVAAGRLTRDQVADAVRARIGKNGTSPKAARLSCRVSGGISLTLSSREPLSWKGVLAALDHLNKEAKKLSESGQDVSALARASSRR